MGQAARLLPSEETPSNHAPGPRRVLPSPDHRFAPKLDALLDSDPNRRRASRPLPAMVSLAVHAVLIAAVIIVPLFNTDIPPAAEGALRAFFAMPAVAAPPPPPPPPAPPAGARVAVKAPAVAPPPPDAFTAPIEVPDQLAVEEPLSLGVEGGVPGGVEGGVPGGVVGGIVGGLPQDQPAPPSKVVRVGGQIKAPKLIASDPPVYPDLATRAHLSALVILEVHVGEDGRVKSATVLRGQPLFDEAALEAVRKWRYRPLLLNGVPTEFIATVNLNFRLVNREGDGS
jgi:periplasmic protein TonB